MSRNKDRMGMGDTQPEVSNPPPQVTQNAGGDPFSFVIPTEFVELPSNGAFYPEGHPLHKQETIEIKQMTAKEEDILTSRSLLKKGVALDRLIKSLVVDKSINTDTMLVGDRNAVLVAARISGYGNEYNTKVTCPSCGAQSHNEFDLHDYEIEGIDNINELDVSVNYDNGTFTTMLPRMKQEVSFRLLTGTDERQMMNALSSKKKKSKLESESNITRQLKQMIVAINGNTDRKLINYVVENMPSMDARHLRVLYRKITPNVNLDHDFECDECGYEAEMEVPLTADFFWPDR